MNTTPPRMIAVITAETRRVVACSPHRASDTANAGVSAWLATTSATAASPSGIREATKKASVAWPAPNFAATLRSRRRPEATLAPAAMLVRPAWRTIRDGASSPAVAPAASGAPGAAAAALPVVGRRRIRQSSSGRAADGAW